MMSQQAARLSLRRVGAVVGTALVCGSCYGGGVEVETQRPGIEESVACPEGQVGFRFPTESKFPSAEAQRQSGEVPVLTPRAIGIQSATCAGIDMSRADLGALREACNGQQSCERKNESCNGSISITYNCGPGDADRSSGDLNEYIGTATQGAVLSLKCQAVDTSSKAEARTACIPRVCRGKTRRDKDMNCVADDTIEDPQTVSLEAFDIALGRPNENLNPLSLPAKDGDPRKVVLYQDGRDTPSVTLNYGPGAKAPKEARLTVWLADQYVPKTMARDPAPARDHPSSVYGFRCVAYEIDVSRDAKKLSSGKYGGRSSLSEECGQRDRAGEDAARRIGERAADFDKKYKLVGTRMFFSWDAEGRNAWRRSGESLAESCMPNPMSFYYDADTDDFDLLEYYKQRQIDLPEGGQAVILPSGREAEARTVLVAAERLGLRKPSIKVAQFSPIATSVPVDVTWSMAYDNPDNPLSPDSASARAGGGHIYGGQGGKRVDPPKFRAEVYMRPHGVEGTFTDKEMRVGSVQLSSALPWGTTVSRDFLLPSHIRNGLFTKGSIHYVDPTQNAVMYDVFFCLAADNWKETLQADWLLNRQPRLKMTYGDWTLAMVPGESDPGSFNTGCAYSNTPLIIEIDRLKRAMLPISSSTWAGAKGATESGDSNMTGQSDNDSTRDCLDDNKTCAITSTNKAGGSGELQRSYYNTSTQSKEKRGESVEVDGQVEILGMQVMDMGDETVKLEWLDNPKPPSDTLTLKLEPPFDSIRMGLQEAAGGPTSAIQWTRGRYGGAIGLGVGFGYRVPFQIGPVPGMILITVTVGVGVSLQFDLDFAPDEEYPCLSTSSTHDACFVVDTTARSLDQAALACNLQGGRLAELTSQSEIDAITNAITKGPGGQSGAYWLGGQAAYECDSEGENASGGCKGQTKTSYRWLSNDKQFASATGKAPATYNTGDLSIGNSAPLVSQAPNQAGVVLNASNGNIVVAGLKQGFPSICQFDHANSVHYLKASTKLALGAAAGVGLSVCTPSDAAGFCILGTVNAISVGINPTVTQTSNLLVRDSKPYGFRGSFNVAVPWDVTLLQAGIYARVSIWVASLQWTIVELSGFRIADGKLYEFEQPQIVNY